MQHRMTSIAIQGTGINSDEFRDSVDRHLEFMSGTGWELVSASVNETSGVLSNRSVDALFFWKQPN